MPTRRPELRAGIHYHIYNRGVGGHHLFQTVEHYLYFLRLLEEKHELHEVVIAAHCLMPNHFHMLLRAEADGAISSLMQGLCSSFSQGINHQLGRQGPMFAGRFKAVPVRQEEYYVHLARYIHRNPLKAGLVNRVDNWPYSNFLNVLGLREGPLRDDSLVPERFATPKQYRLFVQSKSQKAPKGFERHWFEPA